MFLFIIRYLGFLKHVPLLPQVYNQMWVVFTAIFNGPVLDVMETLDEELQTWPGVYTILHKYGGTQYNYHNLEIGHVHGNGLIDMRLGKKLAATAISGGKAMEHHTLKNSGWISYQLKTRADYARALELFKISYQNRVAAIAAKNITGR